jgi:hypothetical protein
VPSFLRESFLPAYDDCCGGSQARFRQICWCESAAAGFGWGDLLLLLLVLLNLQQLGSGFLGKPVGAKDYFGGSGPMGGSFEAREDFLDGCEAGED